MSLAPHVPAEGESCSTFQSKLEQHLGDYNKRKSRSHFCLALCHLIKISLYLFHLGLCHDLCFYLFDFCSSFSITLCPFQSVANMSSGLSGEMKQTRYECKNLLLQKSILITSCSPFVGNETFSQLVRATVTMDLINSLYTIRIGQFGLTLLGFTLLFFLHTHIHTVSFSTPLPPSHFSLIDGCRVSPLIQPLSQLLRRF